MLDIGKLSPGATEYYIGEVATSAEDYYSGRGEHPGRWVGSLAREFGLSGEVEPEHFRRLLNGKHPHSGEFLITAQGSAARAAKRRKPHEATTALPDEVDSLRAAAHLGVSARYVRGLLAEGARYSARLAAASEGDSVSEPTAHLMGNKADGNGQAGSDAWTVSRTELERFAATRRPPKARPGYDLTLRPPKSVSVLWALADDERRAQIRLGHAEAVDAVVRYYESRAVFVRRGSGGRHLVESAGIVAAAFDHRTSRAGDPLLHTHVVTANMTCFDGADGTQKWRAIAGAGLYEHARAAGHLYQAHFRHLLATRLGVRFTPVVNGYAEVADVPKVVIALFSKRRHEIEEVLAESASSSARAAQVATLDTRKAKEYGVDAEALELRWRAEAEAVGFDAEAVAACFGRDVPEPLDAATLDRLFETMAGPHGLTERAATFTRTDAIEAIASAVGASATAAQIETSADSFLASGRALLVDRTGPVQTSTAEVMSAQASVGRSPTQKIYTTPELAQLEARLLAWGAPAERSGAIVDSDTVERVIADRGELSAEQRFMVRSVCTAGEFLQPIAGRPGAGKTYATEAVVAAHVAAGIPILGCAVSAAAAAELERAAGFARSTGASAATVARLLLELDDRRGGGLRPGTVIVVDEASMIGTRDLARLAAHARAAHGALKLVGDPDQHGSVDVGGVFRRLCVDRGSQLIGLVDNNRQQDHVERLAVAEYREGHVADALGRFDEAEKIVRSRTAGESFDAIVADWYAARLLDHADPMIAGPNSTRRALNDRARVLLKAHRELCGEALEIAGRDFMVGDEVVARRNDRRLRAAGSRDFVKNGSSGTVVEVDADRRELVVDFDREGTIRVPHAYLAAGRIEHGYARTTYGVQGSTHDVARYHPTDVSSFEEGYVALTRARRAARIYIVDGTVRTNDDEFTHVPDEHQPFGMREIEHALARRRSGHMAADASAHLAALAETLDNATLAELIERRRQLDHAMREAPADASDMIDKTKRAIEAMRARKQIWSEVLATAQATLEETGNPATCADAQRDCARAKSAIRALDHAYEHAAARLEVARESESRRRIWLDEHADLVAEYELLRRAERASEVQVRARATICLSGAARSVLGPEPDLQRARQAWRRAAEAIAVYEARHGITPPLDGDACQHILGRRPTDRVAAGDYTRAAASIQVAITEIEASPAGPTLGVAL